MSKTRTMVATALMALAAALAVWSLGGCGSQGGGAQGEGSPSHDSGMVLSGTTLDGEAFDLMAYRGKPVVLNYWATWCGYCVREMPELAAFAAAHPDVHVIGVNVNDDQAAAREFVAQQGLAFPQVYDPDGRLFGEVGSQGLPTTLFLDAGGAVREKIVGATDRNGFEAGLKKAQ